MEQHTFTRYPRNWSEASVILNNFEARWWKIIKESNKRKRSREWIRLAKDVAKFYEISSEKTEESQKKVDEAKKNRQYIKLMGLTVDLNFHQKVHRGLNKFIKRKRIPV